MDWDLALAQLIFGLPAPFVTFQRAQGDRGTFLPPLHEGHFWLTEATAVRLESLPFTLPAKPAPR